MDWREWQAAYGAGALLVPASVLQQLVRNFAHIHGPTPHVVDSQEGASVISLVASRFAVSREAAKVRLLQKRFLTLSSDRQQIFLFAKGAV